MKLRYKLSLCVLLMFIILGSCKKIIEIDPPINSIVSETAFLDDQSAEATVRGLYGVMMNGSLKPMNGAITIFGSMSADDLTPSSTSNAIFSNNALLATNATVLSIWANLYNNIFQANSCIEGLTSSHSLSSEVKKRLIGEVKFLRALCYFYLVNLYGDVPLVKSTDWRVTRLFSKAQTHEVYQQIVQDLLEAKGDLPTIYLSEEKVRANKWAAAALLSRVYLYLQNWSAAEAEANDVINNGGYLLVSDLNSVFLKNSAEAILQLQPAGFISPMFNGTFDGNQFIPPTSTGAPVFYFTDQLKAAFETGDQRYTNWSAARVRNGNTYYYPYKYKVRGVSGNTNVTEYYMVLRLAEQYLIRAEAKAKQNDLIGAITDLNIIRQRAGLALLSGSLDQGQIFTAIAQENRVEFFAEWGHRWFDLKRTGQADAALGPIKGTNWQSTDQLYPIPLLELQKNPNLLQNPGYQ